MSRLAVLAAAALAGGLLAAEAGAVTFAAAVPTGRSLSQLAAAEDALVALEPSAAAEAAVRAAGGRLVAPQLGIWALPGARAARLLPRLERLGALRYAEPSRRRDALAHFTDPLALDPELSYHLRAVGADRVEPPGPGFPITILDSGVDLGHPDFAGRPDTVALNPQVVPTDPDDDDYHGTIVASTAAAAQNGVGEEGIYPRALLRIYDLPDLSDESILAGIVAAVTAGPSVLNLSLSGPDPSRALYEATLLAVGTGSLVVASSGNEFLDGNPVLYPAAYPHVLTVAATNAADEVTEFSSANIAVDLAAPGEDIPFQDPTDPALFSLVSGTSFAAPIVAAAAAWVRTVRGPMTFSQLFDLIRFSSRDLGAPGFDEHTGFGLLDLPAALTRPLSAPDPQEPNDDIAQVVANGLFRSAKPLVSARFRAGLDVPEDPDDVYRVSVGRNRRVTIAVTTDDDVRVDLFGPAARTVNGTRARLGASDRAGKATETLTYANRTKAGQVVFLHVSPGARARTGNPGYSVAITTAAARR
jgi:Subtilase family